ncbi:uncharacterized protein LOC101448302 isoform X2 [Ceratitis capitata]|uniref:uncharacterized protein LOC101448302 isoform X2 n=1 Tax=Ceratitis capitata TaxID=7213 RepID=UPI000A103F60|nr:uncharacterized protein LOC101448302 isoform X2 [Ceratitis capitata]
MEMDVNLRKASAIELITISAGSYSNNHKLNNNNSAPAYALRPAAPNSPPPHRIGCCGILGRLLCAGSAGTAKTASSSADYNNLNSLLPNNGNHHAVHTNVAPTPSAAAVVSAVRNSALTRRPQTRRTPQEIYFESRGKSCKKLLKFNGYTNKILLYPEEGWARTASSSYWTITPCWWQPNRCRIEEFTGTQRQSTKAKMVPLEQKGSLLIAGYFRRKKATSGTPLSGGTCLDCLEVGDDVNGTDTGGGKEKEIDEFKLYLTSNISMEDYNMGYCLTGFVIRRCQQTNTYQMTHFAVIKRQWPSISSTDAKSTSI